MFIWRGLQAAGFISKDSLADGTDYKYWRHQLCDLTNELLMEGFRATGNFQGYLRWSDFRRLCEGAKRHASHSMIKRLPTKPMTPETARARFAQLREDNKELWA